MRSGVGKVEEEGLVFVLVFVEAFEGIVGEGIGGVEFLVGVGVAHDGFALDGPAADPVFAFASRRAFAVAGGSNRRDPPGAPLRGLGGTY